MISPSCVRQGVGPLGIGFAIGLLVGIVSGAIFLVLLRTMTLSRLGAGEVLTVIAQMSAIPASWFCGSWLTSALFAAIPLEELAPSYVGGLLVSFLAVVIVPLYYWLWRVARDWSQP
jgi:hypothetical protein